MQQDKCPACGRRIKKRYAVGAAKARYPHKCPHGRKCAGGDKFLGMHANHNVFCPECMKRKEP